MKFCRILISIYYLLDGQLFSSIGSIGAGALTRSGQQLAPTLAAAPNLIVSQIRANPAITRLDPGHISKPTMAQLQDSFNQALDYTSHQSSQFIKFQKPIKMEKPIIVNTSPVDAKKFLNLELLKILRDKTIDFKTFVKMMTALAAMFGSYKLLDFLNDYYERNTILMWAVEADNIAVVKFLLDLGVDIHKKNSDGDTAMLIAARLGNGDMVKLLIDTIKEKYSDNSQEGQEEIARLINTKNNDGRTALLEVVESGSFLGGEEYVDPTEKARLGIVKLFLDNDADLSVQDNNGDNVLFLLTFKMHSAVSHKDSEILREMFDVIVEKDPEILQAINKKGDNLLLEAVAYNEIYLFNYLKDKIIDVMHSDLNGKNIIFKAVQSNNVNMLQAVLSLLENRINTKSREGSTVPLENKSLSERFNFSISGLIGKQSVNVKLQQFLAMKDNKGLTVMDIAIGNRALPMVKLLVKNGAQPTERQLNWAVIINNIDLASILLNNSTLSPSEDDLSMAYRAKNIDLLKILLNNQNISSDLKNKFVGRALSNSLKNQQGLMFDFLLPMADETTQRAMINDIVRTENPLIIKSFLNSSQTTNVMRRELLKDAILLGSSAQIINSLISDPSTKNAYEDPALRALILREALRRVNSGALKSGMRSTPGITKEDLLHDPLLKELLSAWMPKQEASWGNLISDKWAQWLGQKGSRDIIAEQKIAFEKDLGQMISDENSSRKSKFMLSDFSPKVKKTNWNQKIAYLTNALGRSKPENLSDAESLEWLNDYSSTQQKTK